MDLYEAIENRRSIRRFKGPASEDQLRKIILAGTKAPSGGNRQPWEFVIVDDQGIIDRIAEIKYQQNRTIAPGEGETQKEVDTRALRQKESFDNASIVVVCNKVGESPSAWLCIENMCLVTFAEGLGSVITGFWEEYQEEVERTIGVPEGYELAGVIKIGVPAEDGSPPQRRPEFSWLHKNRF
jgi:nitroreductase